MLEALQTQLALMEDMALQLGGTGEEAAALPDAALGAMLRSRLDEIELRLGEVKPNPNPNPDPNPNPNLNLKPNPNPNPKPDQVDRAEARRALQRGKMLGHVVTLLDAERAVLRRVLAERDGDEAALFGGGVADSVA